MSVVSCIEWFNGRRANIDSEGLYHGVRTFIVVTNSPNDGAVTVLAASGLPVVGAGYAEPNGLSVTTLICTNVETTQLSDDRQTWTCTCTYDQQTYPTEIQIDTDTYSRVVTQGIYALKTGGTGGSPYPFDSWDDAGSGWTPIAITNSANEPYDPPIEVDDFRIKLSFKRTETSEPTTYFSYVNCVNKTSWKGFDEGTMKLARISSVSDWKGGVQVWQVTYEFHWRNEGWLLSLLDQGFYELTPDVGQSDSVSANQMGKTLIRDPKTGEALSAPALLDGSGHRLNITGGSLQPVYRTYMVYAVEEFSDIGL